MSLEADHTCSLTGSTVDCAACGYRSEDDLLLEEATGLEATIASIATDHADTLAIDPESISTKRADAVVNQAKTQTTTELLLLLARFHQDVDDAAGAALLAKFAAEFAALESTVV